jgi:hypothetical protein
MKEWVTPAGAKDSWPEVVGLSSEEAKKMIIEDRPDANVQVTTHLVAFANYNNGRVRVFVDSSDKVIITPTIG